MLLRPAQVHAQQHLRPILRLRPAGTRLDVEERGIAVQFACEHSLELEFLDGLLEAIEIRDDLVDRLGVVLIDRERQQFARIVEAGAQIVQGGDDGLERRALLAERLRTRLIVPDIRFLELTLDLGQPLCLLFVVKGTPLTRTCVRQDRRDDSLRRWFP